MGTILFVLAIAVVVAGVVVTRALERKRTARLAAWTFDAGNDDDEIIELDERDVWAAALPPPPPPRAFHHHVHAH